MYRSELNTKDKGGALAAVIAIHVALALAFLRSTTTIDITDPQRVLRVFDVQETIPPPPPPPPAVQRQAQRPQPRQKEGGSAPRNIRSEATPIVAPRPVIELPARQPVVVTETPRQGAGPTQGASDVRGPGTGAGGFGTGTGSGAGGNGPGGGGEGGVASRAQLLTRTLRSRDFPPALRAHLAAGRAPFVIFTVLPSGRVTDCRIYQPSGDPVLDDVTCSLVTSRFVYRPAYNRRGEPIASQIAYRQAE